MAECRFRCGLTRYLPLITSTSLLPLFVSFTVSCAFIYCAGSPYPVYRNTVGALNFDTAPGGFINPSRSDPGRIGVQSTTADSSRYIMVMDGKTVTCVSAVMSAESVLREGQSIGKSMPRKWLTALFHNQEYERFVLFVCLAFNASCVYGQLAHGGVVFQTRMGASKGAGECFLFIYFILLISLFY